MTRILLLALGLVLLPATGAAAGPATTNAPADAALFADVIDVIDSAIPVAIGQSVRVRFPVGELKVVADEVSEVHTELEVRCDKLSEALCTKYSQRLRLEASDRDGVIEVRLTGLPKWKLRKLHLDGVVTVPRWAPLSLQVGIGDVDVYAGDKNLGVRMGIGDLTVHIPEERVRSVRASTGIGDASLRGALHRPGKRRMLIGAKINWSEGEGDIDIALGLRIGDASVVLE